MLDSEKAYLRLAKVYTRRRMTLNSSRDLNSASPSTHYISATKNVCISHEVVCLAVSDFLQASFTI